MMSALPTKKMSPQASQWLDGLLLQSDALNQQPHDVALKAKRISAQAHLLQCGLPSRRDETWQYTPLMPMWQQPFSVPVAGADLQLADIQAYLPNFEVLPIVLVDGVYQPHLSATLPKGMTLAWQWGDDWRPELLAGNAANAFEWVNESLLQQCLMLSLDKQAWCEMPLFLLHIQAQNQVVSNVRCHIKLAEAAQLTVLERHVSVADNAVHWLNSLTTFELAKSAQCQQVVLQELNPHSFYFNNQYIEQAEAASFNSLYIGLGAQLSRHQNQLTLQGINAEAQQNSIVLGRGQQVLDSRSETRHLAAQCVSQQSHKFVLTEQAKGVFEGMIYVDQVAQKTDGQMENRNLLLSPLAQMATKPQLEIYADNVKCAHGCATGKIDDDQVFYLQARGIEKADAQRLIAQAFLLAPLEALSNQRLQLWLAEQVGQQLKFMGNRML